MELPINHNEPTIMHVDLNSCFATVEQQANPLLRGKPIVVAAYATPSGCVVSPSIEAKRHGIKTGMTVRDARLLYPDVIVLTPDPPKYRDVHLKFRKLFGSYSPRVTPKSIDEAVIDFSGTPTLKRNLVTIGREIKDRMRREIGEWISCNVGIAPNRFLAKLAAGLHKPDGLDVISYQNLRDVLGSVELIDLCGINTRYQARLNAAGIYTPLQFLGASLELLKRKVFQSINGYYWYLRLRGWEIDAVDFSTKSFGQSYALPRPLSELDELAPLLMKLTEKMGRRLRRAQYAASGVHVACVYSDWTYWHQGRSFDSELVTTDELYKKALLVFNAQPQPKPVAKLAVSCFGLTPTDAPQLDLFESTYSRRRAVSRSLDWINDRWGEYVITPALMMGLSDKIIDRVSFSGVKELEDLYASSAA